LELCGLDLKIPGPDMLFSLLVVVHPFLKTNRFELLDERPFPEFNLSMWVKIVLICVIDGYLLYPALFFIAEGCLGNEARY
jgi:hypothetical protein